MESRFPGDIRGVMAACAALAERRADALSAVRKAVAELRQDVAGAAVEMRQESQIRRSKLMRMKEELRGQLSAARQAREQQAEALQRRSAAQRLVNAQHVRERLVKSRQQTQQRVAELRTRTRNAQSSRFKSGSFAMTAVTVLPDLAKSVERAAENIVSSAAAATARVVRASAPDIRFLDKLGR